jgi:hypothetical protein
MSTENEFHVKMHVKIENACQLKCQLEIPANGTMLQLKMQRN